ncbi:ATPase family, AAA domain containing 5 [Musa troglodytarum]|uniref:ATPase family, AAA domain containing 5 n=1 Tax=Musa troglodytarum TaxID=320322 RepID=A0A9E7FXR0_9LILI|nr:ATPase family, AAA domain containing 5 [Musa troglodytarum]
MSKSVEKAMLGEIEGTPSPSGAKRQRRCVQSKLCWGRPRGDGGEAGATDVVEVGESEGEDTEGENTGKRERKRKPKAKTPKKFGGKPDLEFPLISSHENKPRFCSILQLPEGHQERETKVRWYHLSSDASKSDATKDLDGPFRPKCNLHLEAKLAAEENMHLSAGKQMHPLFTSRKEVKMLREAQDTKKLEDRQLPGYAWGEVISYAPVHILGTQVDDISLDWGNWNFMEQALDYGGHALEDSLVVCGGLVKALRLDTSFLEEMHMDQTSNTEEKNSTITTFVVSDGQYEKQQPLPYLEYHLNSNFPLLSRCGSYVENSESRHQDELHKERLLSYYRRSEYCPECSLWTAKYQPENASEVCGNFQSVRQLSEWLKSWHDKGQKSGKKCSSREHYTVEDDEILSETEFDMDDREDDFKLSNVLLITGPVGSGKSAAIYACAKEQGFIIIEK